MIKRLVIEHAGPVAAQALKGLHCQHQVLWAAAALDHLLHVSLPCANAHQDTESFFSHVRRIRYKLQSDAGVWCDTMRTGLAATAMPLLVMSECSGRGIFGGQRQVLKRGWDLTGTGMRIAEAH